MQFWGNGVAESDLDLSPLTTKVEKLDSWVLIKLRKTSFLFLSEKQREKSVFFKFLQNFGKWKMLWQHISS